MPDLRYIIADTQLLFADGLISKISSLKQYDSKCVGVASSGKDLIDLLHAETIDVLFLDLSFPDIDGIDLIKEVGEVDARFRIVIVTSYTDHKLVKTAFQNGVDGYFSKFNTFDEMTQCLSNVLMGQTFLSDGLYITPPQKQRIEIVNGAARRMEDRFTIRQKLTQREREVLTLIISAMNNKEIAEALFISDQTVGVHRKNIMRKLGVRNTVNLIKFAIENQLV